MYLKKFTLPGDIAETNEIIYEKRTCFNTFYPFKIFTQKELDEVEFGNITMFYGGNGSGKSTLINLIAAKLQADRYSDFNGAPLFDRFVNMCRVEYYRRPELKLVLTSDDVFDYVLNARLVNERIDEKRNALFDKYVEIKTQAISQPGVGGLKGLDDYERWKEISDILSPRRSQSSFVRERVVSDVDLRSNGETALRYFLDKIDEDGIYLLDEPENSLSIEFQMELADYIVNTARATRSQFVIATHSPVLLAMKGAKIYNLDDYPADVCEWTELPNVRRYFDFFMDHKDEFKQ